MLCERHQAHLEYFSILQIPPYYGSLLCKNCIMSNKNFRFQENYFLIESLEYGQIIKRFRSECAKILRSSDNTDHRFLEESVERIHLALQTDINNSREKILEQIESNSMENISKVISSKIEELSVSSSTSGILYANKEDREKIAHAMVEIKLNINKMTKLSQSGTEDFQTMIMIKLKEWYLDVKASIDKLSRIFSTEIYTDEKNMQLCYDACHLSPVFEQLEQSRNLLKRDLKSEYVENYGVFYLQKQPLFYTCTSNQEVSQCSFRLWNPQTLKPLIRIRSNEGISWPFVLTRKKRYLINIVNDYEGGLHGLNYIAVSKVTSKGIKRLASIKTRILSHLECFEDYDNIIAAEKLVIFVYNIRNKKNIQKLVLSDTINVLRYMPAMNVILIGSVDVHVYNIYNGTLGTLKYTLEGKGSSLAQIQVDHLRNIIYCFHSDSTIRLWHLAQDSFSMINQFRTDISPVEVYTFPEENVFVGITQDNMVTLVSMINGESISTFSDIDKILGVVPKDKETTLFLLLVDSQITIKAVPNRF